MPDLSSDEKMTVNVPALRKALEHVTAHPEEWRQASWGVRTACGTSCCLAGTAVMQSDRFTPVFHHEAYASFDGLRVEFEALFGARDTDGRVHPVADAADQIFGFTDDTYESLEERGIEYPYRSTNTLRELWTAASTLSDGEIEVPLGPLPDGS